MYINLDDNAHLKSLRMELKCNQMDFSRIHSFNSLFAWIYIARPFYFLIQPKNLEFWPMEHEQHKDFSTLYLFPYYVVGFVAIQFTKKNPWNQKDQMVIVKLCP
jgi:hypothetical protein